jgi:hypothetical protein
MTNKISSREERFDEKFGNIHHRGFPQSAIKSFIKDELNSRLDELLSEWKQARREEEMNYEEAVDWMEDKLKN